MKNTITIKGLNDYDIVNYKKPSMFIAFPKCSFKCGRDLCQNRALAQEGNIEIEINNIIKRYLNNPLTKAFICGGLEPFDSFEELYNLIKTIREVTLDDIVIYSGYYENEIQDKIKRLEKFNNLIIKFGRYQPNKHSQYNESLGITLISDNQYVKVYGGQNENCIKY